jgi:REP element-mobilizing transposase RayT
LFRYSRTISKEQVFIPVEVREKVGGAIVEFLQGEGWKVVAVSVGGTHAHLLVELPSGFREVRQVIGECKRYSSRSARSEMPGKVWGEGGSFKEVRDRGHLVNTWMYVARGQEGDAWVWSVEIEERERAGGPGPPPACAGSGPA